MRSCVCDQTVVVREGPGADRRVDLRGARGRRSDLGVLVPRALLDRALELRPGVRPLVEHGAPRPVPHDHDQEFRTLGLPGTSASVSGAPSGASNGNPTSSPWVGAMSASVTLPIDRTLRLDVTGPVQQQRHLGHVVPRPRVRQSAVTHEVGLLRQRARCRRRGRRGVRARCARAARWARHTRNAATVRGAPALG